jgi:enoyl-CoA hydratase
LNSHLFTELNTALDVIATDTSIGAVVITGSPKAFAAGADIKEMKDLEFSQVYQEDFLGHWTQMTSFRKPIIAAVSGYAVRPLPLLLYFLA